MMLRLWTKPLLVYLLLLIINSKACKNEDIRLMDGKNSNRFEGRVEVCLDGYWGTVCDDGWDSNDATTVCRQLGYNHIKRAIPTRRAYFGEGSGPIHLSKVQCRSNDTRLTDCKIDKTGVNVCDHSEDAGVICMRPGNCEDYDVRLVGGENEREGRVEICYNGVWGTVCDDGWDEVDANVVCTQIGYGQPAIPLKNSGNGSGPILFRNINCNANDSELYQCIHPLRIDIHNCYEDNIAGVICPKVVGSLITPSVSFTSQTSADSTNIKLATATIKTSAIFGALGGALAMGVIMVVGMVTLAVIVRRKNQYKGSIDNPTNVEGNNIPMVTNDEIEIQNPPYSEVGPNPTSQGAYVGLHGSTKISDHLYEAPQPADYEVFQPSSVTTVTSNVPILDTDRQLYEVLESYSRVHTTTTTRMHRNEAYGALYTTQHKE